MGLSTFRPHKRCLRIGIRSRVWGSKCPHFPPLHSRKGHFESENPHWHQEKGGFSDSKHPFLARGKWEFFDPETSFPNSVDFGPCKGERIPNLRMGKLMEPKCCKLTKSSHIGLEHWHEVIPLPLSSTPASMFERSWLSSISCPLLSISL